MDKKNKAQKLSKKAVVLAVLSVVLLVLCVALNIGTSMFSSLIDHYVGGRPSHVETVAGSENWDANYYEAKYRGRKGATEAAKELTSQIEGEGAVLLKNDNNALPLAKGTSVSLMGRYAADPVYGGAGSGTVDPNDCVTLYQGISNAGLKLNDTIYNFLAGALKDYPKAQITMDSPSTATYYIGEIGWSDYPADAQKSLSGTTAVLVIGRGGGEGGDLSRDLQGDLNSGVSSEFKANKETANYEKGQHELELTAEEKSLIKAAKAQADKVVVLVNASTSMELGPLMEGEYAVDAIMHIGSLGAAGADAVGKLLVGDINPSGKTTDIWAADFTKDPTFNNFGGKRYTDVENYYTKNANNTPSDGTAYFVEYKEGIYYGYRYYETADAEAKAGNYPGFDYEKAVVFPFGYGLSYSTFEQKLESVEVKDGKVVAKVTVKNTGKVAGKEVAELYYGAPYEQGGPEKSAVVLGAFAKTKLLEPGEEQSLELSFDVSDMASWDSSANAGKGAYVLSKGDYAISLRSDSHTVIAEQKLALDEKVYTEDPQTGAKLENRFADMTEYMAKNSKTFSRSDFKGTWPEAAADKTAAEAGVSYAEYQADEHLDANAKAPVTGANNGLSLIDLRGKDFDDPAWDKLLDQLTPAEMAAVLNDGAYNTPALESIGKPETKDPDGPAGFTSLTGSTGNNAYTSEVIMAQTFNVELMQAMGEMIGQEALASGYNGWYAPGLNTHRSPFAGRNFEYFSEDPLLAGKMAAALISGAAQNGVYAYAKHFALNDQESYRIQHLSVWADEQTIREIYLKPFERIVKEASYQEKYLDEKGQSQTKTMPATTALMSSFNYVGATWAGANKALLTDVLRGEWGFKGFVITDFNLYSYMDKDASLAAGGDHQLTYTAMTGEYKNVNDPSVQQNLRTSTHRMLYTVVNSNAMQGLTPGSRIIYGVAPWQYAVWGASAVLVALAALFIYLAYRSQKKLSQKAAA